MTRDEVRQHLSAYLDAELDESTRRAVEEALEASPELRAELDALRRTAELVHSLPRHPAPAGFALRVAAAIQADAAEPATAPHPAWLLWRTVALAAAGILIAVAALLLVPRHTPPEKAHEYQPPTEATQPQTNEEGTGKAVENAPAKDDARAEAQRATSPPTAAAAKPAFGDAKEPKPEAAPAEDRTAGRQEGKDAERERKSLALAHPDAGAPLIVPGAARATEESERPAAPAPPANAKGAFKGNALALVTEAAEGAARRQAQDKAKGGAERAAETGAAAAGTGQPSDALAQGDSGILGEILRNRPSAEKKLARIKPAAEAKTLAGRAPEAPVRDREVEMVYDDLLQCVVEVRAVLGAANVPYALQPIGSGQFVVEATVADSEAPVLVARLTEAAREVRRTATAPSMAMPMIPPAPPQIAAPRNVADGTQTGGGRGGAGERVRLIVRFRPAAEQAQPAPAEK
jgi:hypothetical protein